MAGENPSGYDAIDSNKVLNKAGLLELCNTIKNEIANNSGGGSSYTAGNRITIDSNNVISTKTPFWNEKMFVGMDSNGITGFVLGKTNPTSGVITTAQNLNAIAEVLLTEGICKGTTRQYTSSGNLADALGASVWTRVWTNDPTANPMTTSVTYSPAVYETVDNNGHQSVYMYPMNGEVWVFYDEATWRRVMGDNIARLALITTNNAVNYNSSSLSAVIPQLDSAISTVASRVPVAPTTDGTYTLQCVVSSGIATYSWVAVT